MSDSPSPSSSPLSTLLWVIVVAAIVLFLLTGLVMALGADDY